MKQEIKDIVIDITDGNIGAINVSMLIINHLGYSSESKEILQIMKDLDLGGPNIWCLFKDVCKQNVIYMISFLQAYKMNVLTKEQVFNAIKSRGKDIDSKKIISDVLDKILK